MLELRICNWTPRVTKRDRIFTTCNSRDSGEIDLDPRVWATKDMEKKVTDNRLRLVERSGLILTTGEEITLQIQAP
jgi:hypothetical protein